MASLSLSKVLGVTIGYRLIGFVLGTALYGATTVQAYFYFRSQTIGVRKYTKIAVILLLLLNTLSEAFFTHALYYALITQWGNAISLSSYPSTYALENLMAMIITLVVQLFLATRLWKVGSRARLVSYPIGIIALLAFASGLASTIEFFQGNLYAEVLLGRFVRIACALNQGLALLCDVLITISMCLYLRPGKSWDMQNIATALDNAFTYALRNGILTAVFQFIALIMFVASQNTEMWMLVHSVLSKVYISGMLSFLNSRTNPANGFQPDSALDLNAPGSAHSAEPEFYMNVPITQRPGSSAIEEFNPYNA